MVHEIVDEQGFLIDLIFNTINKKIKNFAVNKIKNINQKYFSIQSDSF